MKKIALIGPYNENQRRLLYENVPKGFEMYDVPTRDDYAKLADAEYIIIRTIRLTGEDIACAPRLRFVQKWGAGYDNIDVPSVSERNIPIAVCLGINSQPVAEMAVLHMLAIYRNFYTLGAKLREGVWAKDMYSSKAYILRDKKVGIIGLGNIGSKVAKIVQGFGAQVQYFDIKTRSAELERELNVEFKPFEELLHTSDIVSLHIPLKDDTRGMMNAEAFAKMKPSAILVNTSRGGVVNQGDLVQALREGKIAGAGLDVFESEPLGTDCPFFEMENVTMTPHTGGNTADNDVNMVRRCMENIVMIDRGKDLGEKDIVNRSLINR